MRRIYLLFIPAAVFLVSFTWHRKLFQSSLEHTLQKCPGPPPGGIKEGTAPRKTELQERIDAIYHKLEKLVPNVTFSHFNQTTSGRKSVAFIVHPRETYCLGEDLVVQLDMFDHLGRRKTYGGDFLRPRLFSGELGASVSGIVEDFKNGSYHVHFPLYWAGKAKVNILLFHPSEGVAALWRSRHSSHGTVGFQGKFERFGKVAITKCGFHLGEKEGEEICEYRDQLYQEVFYCYKVPNFTCESLNEMRGFNIKTSYLTPEESRIFQRSNIAVEMAQKIPTIAVAKCKTSAEDPKPKCQTGMSSPVVSGYFYRNIWNPVYCNMTLYRTGDDFMRCLQGKRLYLIGDSTLRQFMMHFTEGIKIVKYFGYHMSGWSGWALTLEAMNMEKDVYVSYKRHGFPLEHEGFYYFKEDLYTSRQIDQRAGGKDTIIVITIGQHFRQFPLQIFIRRAINIRRALERLFLRSPDTKVIIKTENTREVNAPVETRGDFHGYVQYLVLKEVFQGINVGFVDAWDMSVASATATVHPPGYTLEGIMSLTFTFAC